MDVFKETFDIITEDNNIKLAEIRRLQGILKEVALHIDWDQQDCSRYYIGEDAAQGVLMAFKFDWELGISNESVEHFFKHISKGFQPVAKDEK